MIDEVEEPEDYESALLCSRVFAAGLDYLLEENQGIVVEIECDPEVNEGGKFLIYKSHGDVAMISCEDKQFEDLSSGRFIWVNPKKLN